jgi:heavy metal translocating P-type ATPase
LVILILNSPVSFSCEFAFTRSELPLNYTANQVSSELPLLCLSNMQTPGPDLLTSVLLVKNIHCPSCVSYAEEVLRPLSDILKVTVSIVSHEVRLEHRRAETPSAAIQELANAAFEIDHLTTADSRGRILRDQQFAGELSGRPLLYTWPFFMSRAQRKHIHNCGACQMKTASQPKKAKLWAALRRRDQSFDVEKQGSSKTHVDAAAGRESGHRDVVDAGLSDEQEVSEYTASLSIDGMTCAACSGSITKELEGLDFVTNVEINLLSTSGTVTYHGPKENSNKIVESIEGVGYGASVEEIKPHPRRDHSEHSPHKFLVSLSIEGMTCGSCIGTITDGLQGLPFVHKVSIDLVGNSGEVEFEGRAKIGQILEKIDDLGYHATVVKIQPQHKLQYNDAAVSERTVAIAIKGMFCKHCPENIMAALHQEFGDSIVVEQPVTLQDPRVRIRYTPSPPSLSIRKLTKAISSTHEAFSTKIWHPPSVEERSRAMQHHEQRRILARVIFTFLVAIPTLIIGVIYMSLVPHGDSTKRWFEEPVWAGKVSRAEWALFLMTTPVMFFGADVFHTRAFKELKALWRPGSKVPFLRRFYRFGSMNLLISAGTGVAYVSSLAVLILNALSAPQQAIGSQSSTYFDTVTFLSFFILVGKFLEAYSKAKTGDAVAMLSKLRPDEALLVESASKEPTDSAIWESEDLQHVHVDMLEVGDKVKVLHGASPPTDGVAISVGTFLFDESSLTGESKPVKKLVGDEILAGSVNVSQPVIVKVTSTGGTSMLDKIVSVVREGQAKRAPVERIADIITAYFVPAITLLAVTTFVIWLALGQSGALPPRYLDNAPGGWAFWSLEFAIAVFVVACPCGLGLAAPTALYVGGGLAAKHGILVRGGGEAFQEASRLDAIVFDKTGTLTEGKMKVTGFEMLDVEMEKDNEPLAFAMSKTMEESSSHPIAKAIADYCAQQSLEDIEIISSDIAEIPGQGMRGKFSVRQEAQREERVFEAAIGNQRLLSSLQEYSETVKSPSVYLDTILSKFQSRGQSTAILYLRCVSINSESPSPSFQPIAVFAISDPIRPSAHSVLSMLRSRHNLQVHMCTGDNPTTAHAIASQLEIPPTHVRAGVMPMDKAAYIEELQRPQSPEHTAATPQSSKARIVAFVGDGTNDTPALTSASVSIALSSGSDIAVSTSSFILLNTDLDTLLTLVNLAKRVFRRVKWNFVWAAVYNMFLVPVAAGVLFRLGDLDGEGRGWRLSPVWASAAMALSSVSVVLSSLALGLPSFGEWWSGRRGSSSAAAGNEDNIGERGLTERDE